MRHFMETTAAVSLSFCMAALVWGQNAAPPAAPLAPGDRAAIAGQQPSIQGREDHILASCLMIDNEGEVKLAKFAKDRAHSPEVKKFADMMIQDHTQFITKLHPFAGANRAASANSNPNANRNPAPRTDAPPANSPVAAPAPAGHEQHFDHLALKRELGDECFKSITAELEKKQGREFDHCYMAAQVMMHQHMKDTLTVFIRHASPNLQTVLKEGLQTTDRHLTEAKRIFETLKDGAETARRPVELPRDR